MPGYKDLTGMRFGKLTVTGLADPYVSPKGNRVRQWNCVCDCGNKLAVRSNFLTSGRVTSCGCATRHFPGRPRLDPSRRNSESDLTGMRFGRLTVTGLAEPYVSPNGVRERRWKCVCDCGSVTSVRAGALFSGSTRSCGCLRSLNKSRPELPPDPELNGGVNLTGMRFGKLTVLGVDPNPYVSPHGHKIRLWKCACDCGNFTSVSSDRLVSGKTKSCGCLRRGRKPVPCSIPDKNS